jgi:hypothetical protein
MGQQRWQDPGVASVHSPRSPSPPRARRPGYPRGLGGHAVGRGHCNRDCAGPLRPAHLARGVWGLAVERPVGEALEALLCVRQRRGPGCGLSIIGSVHPIGATSRNY